MLEGEIKKTRTDAYPTNQARVRDTEASAIAGFKLEE
jgi:hypothetical protein